MAQSVQNTANYNSSAGATSSHSFNLTIGTGTSRKLVVCLAKEASQTVSALTFDGTSFLANASVTITHTISTTLSLSFYYYDIPDVKGAGTYAIAFTTSGSTANYSAYAWQTVNSTTGAPEATTSAEATETNSTPVLVTSNITVTAGALLLAGFNHNDGGVTWDTFSSPITERSEQNETNYTSACADGVQGSGGSKTVSCTNSAASNGYRKILAAVSIADGTPAAPTFSVQPTAQTARVNGDTANTATFTATATGTGTVDLTAEIESGVGSGSFGTLANGSGATWTGLTGTGSGSASVTLVGTFTAKTLSGRNVRLKADDDNGTSYSNEVVLTVLDGPVLSASSATTNGSGQVAPTMTSDDALSADGEILLVTATVRGQVVARTTVRPA